MGTQSRVLLVEDDGLFALLTTETLESAGGHQVHVVDNGRKALEWMERQPFDLVLTGIDMPELDGFRFLHAVRSREKWDLVRFAFITAYSGIRAVRLAHAMGADRYWDKSILFSDRLPKAIAAMEAGPHAVARPRLVVALLRRLARDMVEEAEEVVGIHGCAGLDGCGGSVQHLAEALRAATPVDDPWGAVALTLSQINAFGRELDRALGGSELWANWYWLIGPPGDESPDATGFDRARNVLQGMQSGGDEPEAPLSADANGRNPDIAQASIWAAVSGGTSSSNR